MMVTTHVLSSPMPMTKIPKATQNGVIVRCSGSDGRSWNSTFSPDPISTGACSTSQRGLSLRMSGSREKLPCGGGDVVAHSSVHARQGLSPAISPERALLTRL